MSFLGEWLTNIILLILLATVLEMLLPRSALQRYVKMVVGILLLLLILQPMLSILSEDVEELLLSIFEEPIQGETEVANSIHLQKKEIESGQHAYISEQVADQLKNDVKEALRERYALAIVHLYVEMGDEKALFDEKEIEMIQVFVQRAEEVASSEEFDQVKEVEVVHIETAPSTLNESHDQEDDLADVQQFLSQQWQMSKNLITVQWKGGKRADAA